MMSCNSGLVGANCRLEWFCAVVVCGIGPLVDEGGENRWERPAILLVSMSPVLNCARQCIGGCRADVDRLQNGFSPPICGSILLFVQALSVMYCDFFIDMAFGRMEFAGGSFLKTSLSEPHCPLFSEPRGA